VRAGVVSGGQAILTAVPGARPQALMVPAQAVSRLLSPASLAATTVQLPAGLNVLQQRLQAPGMQSHV
jgi:hypothetical protein